MKLYSVSQSVNNDYDTYDEIIVAANSTEDAKAVMPLDDTESVGGVWVKSFKDLLVREIGTAVKGTKRGIILASYNAG